MDYFFKNHDSDIARRRKFLYEAAELASELLSFGVEKDFIWESVEANARHPLCAPLSEAYLAAEQNLPVERNPMRDFFNKPLFGLIKPNFFGKLIFVGSAVTVSALILFRYFTIIKF
jgi:hypothetical protein